MGAPREPERDGRQGYVDRIVAACERIGDRPSGGRPRDDLLAGLRTFPFERRAVIAYLVEADAVHITNVFYGGRDYDAIWRPAGDAPPMVDADD